MVGYGFMKLSSRTRYGVRAIIELAAHYGEGPLQSKVIAQQQEISAKYLEQLLTQLKSAGFIRSVRGSKGGYILSRQPSEIKLDEIFTALEGPIITAECLEDESYCNRIGDCIARQVWAEVQEAIMKVLESINLQDLADKTKQRKESNYQI
jgi:Rrf2 family protein